MAETCMVNVGSCFVPTTLSVEDCADYIVVDAIDYVPAPSVDDLFLIPPIADMQELFLTGFSIPLIVYLTCWGYGVVINWFNREESTNNDTEDW